MAKQILLAAAACAGALLTTPALAHHSSAMFDRAKTVVLEGTIKQYEFVQPHIWISVMIANPEGGDPVQWDVEGGPAPRMKAMGLAPGNLQPGDKVKIRAHPLHDGRHGGTLIDITLANGKTLTNNVTRLPVGS